VSRALLLGLCSVVWLSCGGTAAPRGPVVSPTGITYAPGSPPRTTRYAQTATLYLRGAEPQRAAELALQGIESDPGNPIHYFLGGVAFARLGAYTRADSLLSQAQRIYPAYELDIEPERLAAWAEAFNRGAEAYADGLDESAIELWRGATLMSALRSEAHHNLASTLAQNGQMDEAATVYTELLAAFDRTPATRVLTDAERSAREQDQRETERRLADVLLSSDRFQAAEVLLRRIVARDSTNVRARQNLASALLGGGQAEEARSIAEGLLAEVDLSHQELYDLGIALFRAGAPSQASEAFRRITEAWPTSRDAWFNYANALLASEDWGSLVEIGSNLLSLDPLGESSALLVARAHLENGNERVAIQELNRIDAAPIHLLGISLQSTGTVTTLHGEVMGNQAPPGTRITLRFIFSGTSGELALETQILAPERGQAQPIRLSVDGPATAYRYEVQEILAPGR